MPAPIRRFSSLAVLLSSWLVVSPAWSGEAKKSAVPSPGGIKFFEAKVRPILAENCLSCHGGKKQRGSLRLDSRAAALEGGDRGPAVVPGQPAKSLILTALRQDTELKMPPTKKLAREQIEIVEEWIRLGAPWPEGGKGGIPVRKGEFQITDKDRAHWSFQPIKRPTAPKVKDPAWRANPIDAFILAGLEDKGRTPNPPAAKHELLRRVHYDLIGLPPTPQEVDDFLADDAPDAYDKLIDRLLASPQYGEKWARHWLDLVHYAETNSYERDNPKPHVWRYRDYVIRAFNRDKPYDRFVREQLAGDEMFPGDPDALIATGFYRLGIWDDEPSDPLQARYDGLDDIVATTGQVFLGLTFDCARCHNHKIDPIAQKDYYRLLAFFHNINHFRNGGPTDEQPIFASAKAREEFAAKQRELEGRRKEALTEMTKLEQAFRTVYEERYKGNPDVKRLIRAQDGLDLLGKERHERYLKLLKSLEGLKKQEAPAERCLCVTEMGTRAPETVVLVRGNPHVKGEKVVPGFPQILGGADALLHAPPANGSTSGRRRVLANWIVAKDNPLTARVIANRIWQFHFGRGIVRSPNDFGLQGTRPTHPELLDWLASEFIESGWRFKAMHRVILTSNAYKMSSRGNAKALAADPANDLFWRFDMRRLSAEEVRDSILAVSGNLNKKMFGSPIYPEIPKEVLEGQSQPGRGWGKSSPEEAARRSVYVHIKRSLLLPILESFDVAETDRSVPVRFATTQPTQALAMLNGSFLNKQAEIFAQRLKKEAGDDVNGQVRLGLYLATSRQPTEPEILRGVRLIRELREGVSADAALQAFCLLVLNLNEFVYLD